MLDSKIRRKTREEAPTFYMPQEQVSRDLVELAKTMGSAIVFPTVRIESTHPTIVSSFTKY